MKKKFQWAENAFRAASLYGSFVDWEEKFYNCPYCGEPIYEDDYTDEELKEFLCPVCEDIDED